LMKVVVGYPSPAEELEIVRRMGVRAPSASQVLTLEELQAFQDLADQVYVDNAVAQYAVDLVMATREPSLRGMPELQTLIEFGVSPRATLGLVSAGRSLALLRGRSYTLPQDIFDVTRDVFRHRLMLSYEALAKGLSPDDVLNRLLAVVPAVALSPVELETKANAAQGRSPAPGTRPAYSADPRPAPPAGFPNAAPGFGVGGPGAVSPQPVGGAAPPPMGFSASGGLGGAAPSGAPATPAGAPTPGPATASAGTGAGAPAPSGAPTPGGPADPVDTSPFPAPGRPGPGDGDRPANPPADRA
ncbi:MAG: MoxR family ATPase, partial [Acidimicrobiia bacterium]|nr:MoxR family ATPase [Acidimicrobiia bacterium]